jgi:ATP-dependent Lon protease
MSTTGLSVLVVDDEPNFLILLDRILSREGYQVTAAISAERAVGQLARENFDLAILDINMYPMSGVELLAAIKDRSPMTQVVMITGYPTDHTRDQSEKLGAVGYLTKPIDISELSALLRQLAETHEL